MRLTMLYDSEDDPRQADGAAGFVGGVMGGKAGLNGQVLKVLGLMLHAVIICGWAGGRACEHNS
jgi:hypothetical protein